MRMVQNDDEKPQIFEAAEVKVHDPERRHRRITWTESKTPWIFMTGMLGATEEEKNAGNMKASDGFGKVGGRGSHEGRIETRDHNENQQSAYAAPL